MSRTKLLTIAVISLLLLNIGTLSVILLKSPPPPHGDGRPPHGEGPKRIIMERLHFDAGQQRAYELLIDDHRSKTMTLNQASRELHTKLYSLLKEESADKSQADTIILQIAENQKAINNLNFAHFQQIRDLCKPEQIKDFNLLAEDLSELFGPKGPPPHLKH
jgi:Spy/CpxP family protein refolding chaperone